MTFHDLRPDMGELLRWVVVDATGKRWRQVLTVDTETGEITHLDFRNLDDPRNLQVQVLKEIVPAPVRVMTPQEWHRELYGDV